MLTRRITLRTAVPTVRRRWRILAGIAAGLVLLAVALYSCRSALIERPLARYLAAQLAAAVDGQASIAGLHFNLLHRVTVDGLRIEAPSGTLRRLEVAHTQLAFSWWRLLRGRPQWALTDVRIDGLELALDTTGPSTPDTGGPSLASILAQIPTTLPPLVITGKVRVAVPLPLPEGATGTLAVAAVQLTSSGDSLTITCTGLTLPEVGIATRTWQGRLEHPDARTLSLHSDQPVAGLIPVLVGLQAQPTGISWQADVAIGSGTVRLRQDDHHLIGELVALRCEQLPPWSRRLAGLPDAGSLEGRVSWQEGVERQAELSLRGEDLRWTALPPSLRLWHAELRADLQGDRVRMHEVQATGPWGGLRMSEAEADVRRRWVVRLPRQLELTCSDVRPLLTVLRVSIPELPQQPLAVDLQLTGEGLSATLSPLHLSVGSTSLACNGTVILPDYPSWRQMAVALAVRIDGALGDWLAAGHWTGRVAGTGSLEGTVGAPAGRLALSALQLTRAGSALGDAALEVHLDWPHLELSRARWAPGGTLSVAGDVDLSTWMASALRISAEQLDCAAALQVLDDRPPLAGIASGHLVLDTCPCLSGLTSGQTMGAWFSGLLATGHGRVAIDAHALAWSGVALGQGTLAATLAGGTLDISGLQLHGPYRIDAQLQLHALAAGGVEARCERLDLGLARQPGLAAHLERTGTVRWQPSQAERWQLGGLSLSLLGGQVDAAAALGSTLSAQLTARGLRPGSLVPAGWPAVAGTLDLQLMLSGTARQPLVSLTMQAHDGRIGKRPVALEFAAAANTQAIRITRADLSIARVLDCHVAGQLPLELSEDGAHLRPGPLQLRASLRAAVAPDLVPRRPGWPVTGLVVAGLQVDATGLRGTVALRELVVPVPPPPEEDATVEQPSSAVIGDAISSWDVQGSAGARGWSLAVSGTSSGGQGCSAQAQGPTTFSSAQPIDFVRTIADAPLTAQCAVNHLELARFQALVPVLVHLEGLASGAVAISGSAVHPRWSGSITLADLALKTRYDVPALTAGSGLLRFDGCALTLEHFNAQLGYAPLSVSGTCDCTPGQLQLDLAISGRNTLVAQSRYLRLRLDMDLHLKGPLAALTLRGEAHVTDALYSEPFDLLSHLRPSGRAEPKAAVDDGIPLFSIRSGPLAKLHFDVRARAEQSLHVRTDLAAGNLSMDLHLGGSGLAPQLQGRLWVDDAALDLPFSSLRLSHAELIFGASNPYSPRLVASGETTLRGYDLTVQIDGVVPDVVITVVSDPPLSTNDGIMLLTTGFTSQDRDDENAGRTQLTMAGEFLAKDLWSQVGSAPDPDKPPGWLDFDRLELTVGEQLTITGENTIDAEYELNKHFYLHGERDLFDDYSLMLLWRLRVH